MKKGIAILCLSNFFLFLFMGTAKAEAKFGFKLIGGLGYIGGGDLNVGLQGWSDIWNKEYNVPGITRSGGYQAFHLGFDLDVEFLFYITPKIALSLGTNYIQFSKSSELQLVEAGTTYKISWHPKVSAIPITLSLYYYLLNGKKMKLFLGVGTGYYLSKYTDTQHTVFLGDINDEYNTSAKGIGFHGGIGLEIPFSPHIAFIMETRGRHASLSGFEGELKSSWMSSTSTTSGKLWFYEINAFDLGKFSIITLENTKPVGADITNVNEAKIDLSGFSAIAGFIFRF